MLAIIEVATANCIGVIVIYPCPIPILTVSPTYQDSPKVPNFQFLVGRLALDSLSKSIPETNPKPNFFRKSEILSIVRFVAS